MGLRNKKKISLFQALVLLMMTGFLLSQGGVAMEPPQLKGRINDLADIITAHSEQELDSFLSDFERTDVTQIVVLTIPSLDEDRLEDFSIRTAEK